VERCLGQSNRWIRLTKDPVPERSYAVKELIEDNVYESVFGWRTFPNLCLIYG